MAKAKKKSGPALAVRVIILILLVLILTIVGYVIYLQANYYRIEDHAALEVENNRENMLKPGDTYTAVTYNIGFGAYGPDYSFFMDTGEMKDGTKTAGKYGKAISQASVEAHTEGAVGVIESLNADFYLLQEVDVDADRSYHVDQEAYIKTAMTDYASIFANNFHSAYLFYPFNDPHGAVQAGLLSFSRYQISEAERRSYPVDNSLSRSLPIWTAALLRCVFRWKVDMSWY